MNARLLRLLPWAPLPALLFAILGPAGASLEIPWLLLGMQFGLDDTGRSFLFFSALLWLFAGWQARDLLAHDPRQTSFALFFVATLGGNLLLILAADLAGFYFGYALMTFAAYGLVVHKGSPEAWQAGRVYLVMALLGEALLLLAFLQLAALADSLRIADVQAALARAPGREGIMALLAAGFGIKAGALTLHLWLPLAHPVAPVPASAVLSGVLIKAGLLGWLRFLPLGMVASDWGWVLAIAGLIAVFYGVIVGLAQTVSKVILAYSSISQMGLMTLAVGLGLAVPDAWPLLLPAVILYALHHALTKGALFLGLALVGPGRRSVLAGMALLSLSLAGAPLLSGALAKYQLKVAVPSGSAQDWILPMLALGSLATTLLMARLLWLLAGAKSPRWTAPPARAFLTWWLLVLLALTSTWWWPRHTPMALGLEHLGSAAWPVLGGSLLAWWAARRFVWRWPAIPAGDLLWPLLRAIDRLRQAARWPLPPLDGPQRRLHWPRWPEGGTLSIGSSRAQGLLLLFGLVLLLAMLSSR